MNVTSLHLEKPNLSVYQLFEKKRKEELKCSQTIDDTNV